MSSQPDVEVERGAHLLDGRSLTVKAVVEVARHEAPVRLGVEARDVNESAWHARNRLTRRGEAVYGYTTEVGARSAERVDPSETTELQLLRGHACGTGALLAPESVRATLAVRANQLAVGGAGVSPTILDGLVQTLNSRAVPEVHEIGSLGTGDLTALAEIGLALGGEGFWEERLGPPPSPLGLGPGDAIGLLSSNASTIGQAALACHDTQVALESADDTAAISYVAARADATALDRRVHEARPHPGQRASAAHLRRLVGSSRGSGRLQDALCCRSLPQVHGAARDAVDELRRVLIVELNSGAENPLVLADSGEILNNGNFHTARLALVVDQVRAALAHAGSLAAVRISRLLDGSVTGLPGFLTGPDGGRTGAMVIEYPVYESLAELRAVACPVTTATTVVCGGVENHASFAPLAVRQLRRALQHYTTIVACELVVAVRALRLAHLNMPTGKGQNLFSRAAADLPEDLSDRPLSVDIDAAARLVRSGFGRYS